MARSTRRRILASNVNFIELTGVGVLKHAHVPVNVVHILKSIKDVPKQQSKLTARNSPEGATVSGNQVKEHHRRTSADEERSRGTHVDECCQN